ncbi:MAG: TonB-dependent receptor plug protein [uncultured bacterium]|nr:MAG: TonB-dependent receptor plug protein [uncultured bacterium]HBG18994.1 hypothetical protein [Desulfobulbaceae bacterium]
MNGLRILLLVGLVLAVFSPDARAADNTSIVPADILKMSFEEMMNIKITTAGKKEERVADIPASAVIITRQDIELYGYMSLEEILENVPGMYAIDDYAGYRKTFGVRGFYAGYPRNIIFLINGVAQTESLFDYNEMSNFNIPVEAIDRIEVVRGPMSVLYGQGAFFGAINIITNSPEDNTSLAAGSLGNGKQKAATKIAGTQGDFNYSLSAGLSNDEGPNHQLSKMVSNLATLRPWGVNESNATTEDKLERDSGNFIFSGKYKGFYTDLMFNRSSDEVFIFRPSVTDGSTYDREMAIASLGYENQVTDNIRLNGKMAYHNFNFNLDWDIANSSFTGAEAGESRGGSDYFEYELDAFLNVAENLEMTTGLYYKNTTDTRISGDLPIFNLSEKATTSDEVDLWAIFAQANYTPWKKIRFVTGLRLEQMLEYGIDYERNPGSAASSRITGSYDEDEVEVIPSLAAIYSFNEKNIVKLLYGKAIARASFFQTTDQVKADLPNLAVEEIDTYEANYITTPSSEVTVNFSLFHNVLDNLIVRTVSAETDRLATYFANGGKLVTNGAELSLQVKPLAKLLTELSLTYQDTEDQRDGFEDIEVAYSPHFLGYAKMAYQFTDKVGFALTGTYVDEMETEWDIRLNNFAGGRVGKAVDGYYLLGANLRIDDLFGTGCYFNLRGSNLLDEEYRYPTYINNTWADRGTLGESLQVLATVGMKF